jgi:hypothetical protein
LTKRDEQNQPIFGAVIRAANQFNCRVSAAALK